MVCCCWVPRTNRVKTIKHGKADLLKAARRCGDPSCCCGSACYSRGGGARWSPAQLCITLQDSPTVPKVPEKVTVG